MANRDVTYDLDYATNLSLDGKPLACLKLNNDIVWEKAKDYIYIPPKSYIDTGVILTNYTTRQEERTREKEVSYSHTCSFDCKTGTGTGGIFSSTKNMQRIGGGPYGSYGEYPYYTYNFTVPSNAYSVSVRVTFTRRTARNEPSWVSSRTGDLLFNGTAYSSSPQTKTSTGAYTVSTTQSGNAACYGTIEVSYKVKVQETYYVEVKDFSNYRVELDYEIDSETAQAKGDAILYGAGKKDTTSQIYTLIDATDITVGGCHFTNFSSTKRSHYLYEKETLCNTPEGQYFPSYPKIVYDLAADQDIPNSIYPLYLNAINYGNEVKISKYGMKVYGFRVYYNDVLQYDFVPARNGMKNTKNNVFHPIINTNYFHLFFSNSNIKLFPNEICRIEPRGYSLVGENGIYNVEMKYLKTVTTWGMSSNLVIPEDVNRIKVVLTKHYTGSWGGGQVLVINKGVQTSLSLNTEYTFDVSQDKILQIQESGSCNPKYTAQPEVAIKIEFLE